MVVTDRETVRAQLIQVINGAFEECARKQQELQRKVSTNIMDLFEQHCLDNRSITLDLLEVSTEVAPGHLPVPVVPQSTFLEAQPIQCKDNSNFVIQNRSSPAIYRDPMQLTKDVTHEVSLWQKALSKSVTKSSMADKSYSASRYKDSQPSSSTIFLTTTGKFTYSKTLDDLPSWVRLSELLLNSNDFLLSQLASFWSDVIAPVRSSNHHQFEKVVEASTGRQSFLLKIKKALRQADEISLVSSASNLSQAVEDGFWKSAARTLRRFCPECKRDMPAFPIHPCSGLRLSWDGLCMINCVYDLILLPMIAFETEHSLEMHDSVHLCVAMFWTLDMCMSFNTAYFDGFSIQRNYKRIAFAYMRSWFWIDLLIVLNDWVSVLASKGSFGALRYAKLVKTSLRLVRLGRLWKVTSHYQMAMQTTNSEFALSTIKIGTQAFCVTIICHYVACIWYGLHALNSSEKTWAHEYLSPDATIAYRYCTSLHWALTQLLPASIGVQPVNLLERVYNIVVILVSMVLFSSFISSITVSMNHLRACRSASIQRDGQLRQFLQHFEIHHEISHNIWCFLKQSARSSCYTIKPREVLALKNMPEQILESIYKDAFDKTLRIHPLFAFYNLVEPQCIAKLCRTGVEQHVMLSRESLWHDFVVTSMIFVRRGTLIYEKAFGSDLRTAVEAGGWCCEEALWAENPRIEAPFSASESGCEVLMVDPDAFRICAKQFHENPNSLILLARYGEEFTLRFNQACSSERLSQEIGRCSQHILFNDAGMLMKILDGIVHHYYAKEDNRTQTA